MKQVWTAALATFFCLIGSGWLHAQLPMYATCSVVVRMANKDRRVLAPNLGVNIMAECPGSIHSAPFGNWGVSSNVGTKKDGNQFQGWKLLDGKMQWNSCTSAFPPVNCSYYNYEGCTKQKTSTGIRSHGTVTYDYQLGCPSLDPFQQGPRGCEAIDGQTVGFGNNFMTLYELDPWDDDELVGGG